MATQAAAIAETVMAMRKALSIHQYSSDSDNGYLKPSNRGNKLKRRAQYVREGRLDLANGPKTYKRKIEHAGHERYILQRNPKRYDEDGDELDDEDADEDADADALRRNPLGEIKLESLLAPLTSAHGLADHPSLSVPYRSKILPDLTQQACDMVQKEKRTLWNVKHLLTKFRGDQCWAPGEMFLTEYDEAIFSINQPIDTQTITGQETLFATDSQNLTNGTEPKQPPENSNPLVEDGNERTIEKGQNVGQDIAEDDLGPNIPVVFHDDHDFADVSMSEDVPMQPDQGTLDGATQAEQEVNVEVKPENIIQDTEISGLPRQHESLAIGQGTSITETKEILEDENNPGLDAVKIAEPHATETQPNAPDPEQPILEPASQPSPASGLQDQTVLTTNTTANSNSPEEPETHPPPHRMRTRAQAQATTPSPASSPTRSPSPTTSIPTFIHPLFLIPPSAIPSRDFGLPSSEAEETRRILTLYVQKQEEVCRGVEKLYEGLLKADRMRKEVMDWCKAEGHVGELSDGEDWYDREAWGLEEELRKGQAEEEDEEERRGKKTRRRAQ